MGGTNSDLRQMALQYRERLKSELAKVDQFLDLAEDISRSSEAFRSDARSGTAESLELQGEVINVFRESG